MTNDEVIAELVDLMNRSGWLRLEIVRRNQDQTKFYGYCVDANGDYYSVQPVKDTLVYGEKFDGEPVKGEPEE